MRVKFDNIGSSDRKQNRTRESLSKNPARTSHRVSKRKGSKFIYQKRNGPASDVGEGGYDEAEVKDKRTAE